MHLLRELGLRSVLRDRLSQRAYMGLYALLSLLGLSLIIVGKSQAPFVMLWQPIFSLQYITHMLMIPAFILVLAGNMPTSHIRAQLRNPMVLGVAIWGGAHLWSNGDLASVLLFGSFCLWGMIKFITLRKEYDDSRKPSFKWDLIVVLVGFVAYLLIMVYHGQIFGIGVIP